MKKLVMVVLLLVVTATVANAASINGEFKGNPIVKVFVDGKELAVENTPAVIYNGNTLVPINMLRQLGATVEWNADAYSINLTMPKPEVVQIPKQTDVEQLAASIGGVEFVSLLSDGKGLTRLTFYYENALTDFFANSTHWNDIIFAASNSEATSLDVVDRDGNLFSVPVQNLRDFFAGKMTDEDLNASYYIEYVNQPAQPIQQNPVIPQQTFQEPVIDNTKVCEDIRYKWALEIANAPKGGTVGKVQWEIKQRENARDQELADNGCN